MSMQTDIQNSLADKFRRKLPVSLTYFHLSFSTLLHYLVKYDADILSTSLSSRTAPAHRAREAADLLKQTTPILYSALSVVAQ